MTPTGTVVYGFFANSTCTGAATSTQQVTLNGDGTVPPSNTSAPLGTGSYAFEASYSGDANYTGSTGVCESFSVSTTGEGATTITTSLANTTGTAIANGSSVALGTSVDDTATVKPIPSATTPTGTVTYRFFDNSTCAGTAASTQPVNLNGDGTVPASNPSGALTAGGFGFEASYSGDAHYTGSIGVCEPFSVSQGSTTLANTLKSTSGTTIGGGSTVALGTSVYDTVSLTPSPSVTIPTGSVTYGFFDNLTCAGTAASTQQVTLNGDVTVPASNATGALTAGNYAFEATYSGDANYGGGTAGCEPFSAQKSGPAPSSYFVTPPPFGNDFGGSNTCTLKQTPCATIAHALREEAALSPGAKSTVITLAKGTYNDPSDVMFSALSVGNDNVTITGAGKATAIDPQNCGALAATIAGEDAGASAIINFQGLTGVTIENLTLNGGSVAGGVCPNYLAAVLGPRSPGGTQNSIVNTFINGGAPYGILQNDNAGMTIISNTLVPVLCTAKVKGPNFGLNAGWGFIANLKLNKIPACAQFIEGGHGAFTAVFINGVGYTATFSALTKTIVLTGYLGTPLPSTPEIPVGATVIFNTSVAPFTQYGIACNSPAEPADITTTCAISDNTVTAGGWVYSNHPVGIVVTGGATANVDGNTVSGIADTAGDGTGIALIPASDGTSAGTTVVGVNELNNPSTGKGNKVSASDTGIVVHGVDTGFNDTFSYQVNANVVSSANVAGLVLADLGYGFGSLGAPAELNSVSGVPLGSGIILQGVKNQVFGGASASTGNTSSGNGLGLVLLPCTDPVCQSVVPGPALATTANTVQNNSMTNNSGYGVLTLGGYQPLEVASSTSGAPGVNGLFASTANTFNSNTWTGNSTSAPQNHASNILDGTGWGGGCAALAGACDDGAVLVFEGVNTSFSSTSPGSGTFTLAVCNPSAISEPLPVGSQVTFSTNVNAVSSTSEAGDGGTFFVTVQAIVLAGSLAACTGSNPPMTKITLQAIRPAKVGTLGVSAPQPYTLGTFDQMTVDVNGPSTAIGNSYGTGPTANSCSPLGAPGVANSFGMPAPPGSTTLNAGTGGVNATYDAC